MERVGLVTRLAIHIIVCPRESNSLHLTEKKKKLKFAIFAFLLQKSIYFRKFCLMQRLVAPLL